MNHYNYSNKLIPQPQDITSLIDSSYIDGTIYCKLERQSITTILGNEFNLRNDNFHFMVAIGTTVSGKLIYFVLFQSPISGKKQNYTFIATSLTRHDLGRIASSGPLDIVGVSTLKDIVSSQFYCQIYL